MVVYVSPGNATSIYQIEKRYPSDRSLKASQYKCYVDLSGLQVEKMLFDWPHFGLSFPEAF